MFRPPITRLRLPSVRQDVVKRPRLTNLLDSAREAGQRLVLVVAAAGSGKTTLVADWALEQNVGIAWLTLDESDNDPVQFVAGLIGAFRQINPMLAAGSTEILAGPQVPPLAGLVADLIDDLAAAPPLMLVLDDYHLIRHEQIHRLLSDFINQQPPTLLTIMMSRTEPPLPLARMRVRHQLKEVTGEALRFSDQETARFFQHTMALPISTEQVQQLQERTEGWIAGLQLAALTLRQHPEQAERLISNFAGDTRHVADYLLAELLEQQSTEIHDFLQQTALLNTLCAPLCNALTGRQDSQNLLEQLEASHTLIFPLDDRREWYRYHRLLAEWLRTQLSPEVHVGLHQRASAWYEAEGDLPEAIHHALASGTINGNYAPAQRLIGIAADNALFSGALVTLISWLDALPPVTVQTDSTLSIYRAWAALFAGDTSGCRTWAVQAESLPESMNSGKLALLQATLALSAADYPRVYSEAGRALELLGKNEGYWLGLLHWSLAEAHERTGDLVGALESLDRVVDQPMASLSVTLVAASRMTILNELGRRREALALCNQLLEPGAHLNNRGLTLIPVLLGKRAELYLDGGLLERALADVERALDERLITDGLLEYLNGLLGRIRDLQGDTLAALTTFRKARRYTTKSSMADTSWLEAWEAEAHLRMGNLNVVRNWAKAQSFDLDAPLEWLHFEAYQVYVRLLIARGEVVTARMWLDRLLVFAQAHGALRRRISLHLLLSMVAPDKASARLEVGRALDLAAPEGYVGFFQIDARVLELLPSLRSKDPALVDAILNSVRLRNQLTALPPNPLSERETEVLRLISAGLSNVEIANRLFIAPATVKRHINHIYAALGVSNRIEAIARAKALNLVHNEPL
ncbi:MAG: AAA family ATPase [Anaerolineae bacterium]|nr:AAA family ATPase [Anaerolineae bacterium]